MRSGMMDDSPKLTVICLNSICEVLRDGTAKLELIQTFPVDEEDCSVNDEGACHSLVDSNTFLHCKDVQGALNKQKLRDDCRNFIQLLSDVTDELNSKQTFSKLIENVEISSNELLKAHFVLKNYYKQKNAVKKVEGILASQKLYDKQREVKADSDLLNQRFKHHKNQLDIDLEKKFNETWVNAQISQNEIKLNNELARVDGQLLDVARKTYDTDDINFKVIKFYKEKLKELYEQIDHMSTEYDIQLEKVETELQMASNDKRQMQMVFQAEHVAFEKREREIRDYLDAKRKKAEATKLHELQEVKVVVIQAWWRGAMVRRHLGRFKSFKKRAKEVKKEFRVLKAQRKKKTSKK